MRTRLLSTLAVTVLSAGACASDEPATTADQSDVTSETTPPVADSVPPVSDTSAQTVVEPTEPATTTTSTLVPSPEADLPTEPPPSDDDPAPVVTLAGPLPIPAVALTEVGAFDQPTEATAPGLGPLMFVTEKPGRIVAFDDLSSETVLDITGEVNDDANEQGLLGLAFHPDLDFAYVDYTDGSGATVVAEFAVDPVNGAFDASTFRQVLRVEQPFGNHNGGEIAFGPDGLLYIGLGDGGAADDPNRAGLDVTTKLGKILRIDPVASGDDPFVVPDDNPFVELTPSDDGATADPTIWSVGVRNPWKFSFDSLTGDLWIADVGQNRWEEIDFAPAVDGRIAGRGVNFGWSAFEGNERFNSDQLEAGHTPPVIEYLHENGHCSVSGGAVARTSTSNPGLNGWYVYGDFCSGAVWAHDTTTTFDEEPVIIEVARVPALAAIVEGSGGDLFALSLDGPIFRLDTP